MDYCQILLMELGEACDVLEKNGCQVIVSVTGTINKKEANLNLRVVRLKLLDQNRIGLVTAHFEP
jgi:hypothetical protein